MPSPAKTSSPACVLGIDVGGTKIAAGIVRLPDGQIVARRTIPTEPQRGGRTILNDVLELARALHDESSTNGQKVQCLGLGICELVDREGHLASANCIQWLDQPVVSELNAIAPAILEADVRAAALAESELGAGKNFRTFL